MSHSEGALRILCCCDYLLLLMPTPLTLSLSISLESLCFRVGVGTEYSHYYVLMFSLFPACDVVAVSMSCKECFVWRSRPNYAFTCSPPFVFAVLFSPWSLGV